MDKVTQSNAAGAEESASASEELSSQAEMMREAVRGLRQLVGGGSAEPARTVKTPARPAKETHTTLHVTAHSEHSAPAAKSDELPAPLAQRKNGSMPAVSLNGNGDSDHNKFFS
jgi:methyl-accepting chemotaxis protein